MKHVIRHQGHFDYKGRPVRYWFWSNTTDTRPPDVVIFLGAGQTGAISRMVARQAGSGVIVVGGVPHWHTTTNAQDIEDFTLLYFEHTYRSILTTFQSSSMHIVAESQAAPIAIILAGKLKEVQNLSLIRPLGFSVEAFGATVEARLKTFTKRILRTSLQYPQSFIYDPRNLVIALIQIRAMAREKSLRVLRKKYGVGISYNALQDMLRAVKARQAAGHSISFILGAKDKMFPPAEILAALKSLGISGVHITVLPGVSHSSLATRSSRKVLATALDAVRQPKLQQDRVVSRIDEHLV